jgi:hypothetical protein
MGSRTDGLDTVISERAIAQAAGQVASDYHDSYQVASKGRFNLKGEGLPRVGNLKRALASCWPNYTYVLSVQTGSRQPTLRHIPHQWTHFEATQPPIC